MTTMAQARNSIVTIFNAAMSAYAGRVAYDNLDFTPPSPIKTAATSCSWVRLSIEETSASAAAVGIQSSHRQNGIVFASCYTPVGSDMAALDQIAKDAFDALHRVSISGIIFYDWDITRVSPAAGEVWALKRLAKPFSIYQTIGE